MAATKEQLDTAESTFNSFVRANQQYHAKHAVYKKKVDGMTFAWSQPSVALSDYLREALLPEKDHKIAIPPTAEQQAVIDAYAASNTAVQAFRVARNAYGADAKNTEAFIAKVEKIHASGQQVTAENTVITSNLKRDEGKDVSFADAIKVSREDLAKAEKAAAAKKAAEDAAKAKTEGLDSLKESTALVSKGIIINIDGKSKAHEPARIEIAKALEKYFGELNEDNAEALGLEKGVQLSLVNKGGEITDRKLLGKALRHYQSIAGMGVDGKVGPATLESLLYVSKAATNTGGLLIIKPVTEEKGIGHLGGKFNPYSLQDYKEKKDDPRNAEKLAAQQAIDEVKAILAKMATKVSSQEAKDGYTDKEDATLKALFKAEGEKAAPLDTGTLSKEGIIAFQKAFGLKANGVIGPESARALAQINIRLNTDQVIDPSEIRAAVVTNALPAKKAEHGK